MAGDNGLISLKEFNHLDLTQPDRLLPEVDFKQALPAFDLADDYFTLFILYATPRCRMFEEKNSAYSRLWAAMHQILRHGGQLPATRSSPDERDECLTGYFRIKKQENNL